MVCLIRFPVMLFQAFVCENRRMNEDDNSNKNKEKMMVDITIANNNDDFN